MNQATLSWQDIKSRTLWASRYLIEYIKNPLSGIRSIPEADWTNTLVVHILVTIPSGILGGILSRKFMAVLSGLVLFPIISFIFSFLGALFLQYAISFLFERTLTLNRLFLTLTLANVPFLLLRILYPFLPPVELIGLAFTGILLIIGLVDNFQLPKRGIMKLIGLFYALFFVFWVAHMINSSREEESFRQYVTPDSLEILDKEIQ